MSDPEAPNVEQAAQARRLWFILALCVILLVTFIVMISDLLLGVIGGVLLWMMTRRLHQRLTDKLRGRRGGAAGLSLIIVLLVIVIPLTGLLVLMAADAASLAYRAAKWIEPHKPLIEQRLEHVLSGEGVVVLGYEITADEITARLQKFSAQLGQFLVQLVQQTAGGIASAVLLVFVMLYTLFFFYLDGDAFFDWLKQLLPLRPEQSERLFAEFFATSKASLKTMGVIGVVQGGLGGLAFWIVGIPAPLFWTLLMAVATIIPVVGAQIVLIPAAALLMLFGKFWFGFALLLWAWLVIANVDNLLRPYLVSREVNLHELLVFLSSIGGIAMFGFFGVLIGPVIASLLKVSLNIYREVIDTTGDGQSAATDDSTFSTT